MGLKLVVNSIPSESHRVTNLVGGSVDPLQLSVVISQDQQARGIFGVASGDYLLVYVNLRREGLFYFSSPHSHTLILDRYTGLRVCGCWS
jgi:hypothetical protein